MATKAEWFRYHTERAGPKKAKAVKKAKPGPKPHNLAEKDRKALYAFEDFAPGTRPSRKTTRKASNRQKTDAKFRLTRAKSEVVPRKPAATRSRAR
ncbi:MAG: hypothetical protein WB493_07480 [Anaeromyxobacteraceae bacterium]